MRIEDINSEFENALFFEHFDTDEIKELFKTGKISKEDYIYGLDYLAG